MATLDVHGSPLFDPAYSGEAEIRLVYSDRFNNEYQLVVSVPRQLRADGGFNMVFDWRNYQNIAPSLSKARLREIGAN